MSKAKKVATRRAPKVEDEIISPPEGWTLTNNLRFIDGQLHQQYLPVHPGETGEHWQPVEAWDTDAAGELEKTGTGQ